MISASVKAFDYFPEVSAAVDRLAITALDEAASVAAAVAAAAGAPRNATAIQIIPAHGTVDGFSSGISGKWYYRFQSFGTLGNAIHPKRPGSIRSHAPGTGIEPNKMFQLARSAGRRRLIERLWHGF